MRKTLFIVLVGILCPHAFGESYPQHSAGVRIAGRFHGYPGDRSVASGIVGAEACLYCEARGVFLEYSHFFPPGSGNSAGANLVAAGMRLQGRQNTRFFFDIGIAAGNSRANGTSVSTVGAALGVGLQVNRWEHFYLSPFFRTYPMTHSSIAESYGAGIGWRF